MRDITEYAVWAHPRYVASSNPYINTPLYENQPKHLGDVRVGCNSVTNELRGRGVGALWAGGFLYGGRTPYIVKLIAGP